ncbi:MAG: isoprenylcysteine carboxylmethyltransferase family protein [Gammaproteobacteria bacterium]|nr:isoprenylcysteine carboxylmethyltransferase family protein [Gammaproteobacteria bacterium]
MPASRSTPRLRLTALLLCATLLLVAVSERHLCAGVCGELMQLAGLAFISCAALGRIWSSAFVAGHKDASLVREGPYSALRHPLYALSMLAMLGVGLATRSSTSTAGLVVIFGALYSAAARREDRFLAEQHGAAFNDYARRVRGFLPDGAAYHVPEALEIRPRIFWKAFLDAGSLVGIYVLLRLADLAQLQGVTPTWFALP